MPDSDTFQSGCDRAAVSRLLHICRTQIRGASPTAFEYRRYRGSKTYESQTLLVDGKVLMLGRSPFRIDILTKIDGVTYDEVEASCEKIRIDELWVPVISPQMLLRNKEASGRPKDLLDANELRIWLDKPAS